MAGIVDTNIKATNARDFYVCTTQYCLIIIEKWIEIRERIQEWVYTDFLKKNTSRIKNWIKMSMSVTFFRVPTINIPANTEVKYWVFEKELIYRRLLEIGIMNSE